MKAITIKTVNKNFRVFILSYAIKNSVDLICFLIIGVIWRANGYNPDAAICSQCLSYPIKSTIVRIGLSGNGAAVNLILTTHAIITKILFNGTHGLLCTTNGN